MRVMRLVILVVERWGLHLLSSLIHLTSVGTSPMNFVEGTGPTYHRTSDEGQNLLKNSQITASILDDWHTWSFFDLTLRTCLWIVTLSFVTKVGEVQASSISTTQYFKSSFVKINAEVLISMHWLHLKFVYISCRFAKWIEWCGSAEYSCAWPLKSLK